MENKYAPLFQPLTIGNMTLKNRIALSPMASMLAENQMITDKMIAYYADKARGGAGMIMTDGFACCSLSGFSRVPALFTPMILAPLVELTEAVHAGGSKLCVEFTFGGGRNSANPVTGEALSSSETAPVGWPDKKCTPMTIEQIHTLVAETGRSAKNVFDAGCDAIVLHAHNGYLIDNFMSSGWNLRTDEYGGDVHGRMKLPLEIISAIRAAVGPDFPIIYRITLDLGLPEIRDKAETIEILKVLETSGINAIDVDCGCYETIDRIFPGYYFPDACALYATDWVREAGINLPILNAGNHTPETALEAVASGKIDIALFGRPLLADPQLPNKLLAGKPEEIRPCLKCNMGCVNRGYTRLGSISCAVNAQAGYELRTSGLKPCAREEKVTVIGGGPAGLEAARVSALRGAKVTLIEKSDKLGGTARMIATPDWKYRFRDLFAWYELQMKELGVNVLLGTEVDASSAELAGADQIFVATGSDPIVPPIPGIDGENVVNVLDVHKDMGLVKGENVVVCGGGMSGCELALELAEAGKKVTIVDMLPSMANDAARFNGVTLMAKLNANGVRMLTNTRVKAFTPAGVVVEREGKEETLPADTAVHAFGIKPNNAFGLELMKAYPGIVQIIGDANKVNCIYDAVHAGYNAASSLL